MNVFLRSRRKKFTNLLLIFMLIPSLQACADLKEINNIAIVTATRIDMNNEGKIEVTIQLFLPQTPSMGSQNPSQITQFAVLTSTGDTISEAVNNIEKRVSRQLFRGHERAIIIGERMASKHMNDVLDYCIRFREIRERTLLFVTKEPAPRLLQYEPFMEKNSGEILNKYVKKDGNLSMTLKDIVVMRANPSHSYIIPMVAILNPTKKGERQILKITQSALFSHGKMVGTMSNNLTYGQQILNHKFWQTVFSLKFKKDPGKVGINIQNVKAKITPIIHNGQWTIQAHITGDEVIFENTTHWSTTNLKTAERVDHAVGRIVSENIRKSVRKSQKMKSDVFNFYNTFYRKYPSECLKVEKNWSDVYPTINVKVTTNFHLIHSGIAQ